LSRLDFRSIQAVESLKGRDFLRVSDWSREELLAALDLADQLKDERKRYVDVPLLPGRSVGLLLEKPSLRTRVSFELAVYQLGGHAVHLTGMEVGLGHREPIRDIGYVLSRYLDAIMVRTFAQSLVEELAEHAYVPVVNGLTDEHHPCQALADAMTIRERLGGFEGVRIAWLGDGNNVCVSLAEISAALGMEFVAATPPGYEAPGMEPLRDPREAARGANVVVTDAWTSMGQEEETQRRRRDFAGYRIDADLLALAEPDAIVLHCLPAHIGDEITEDVIYGPRCAAWDEAENRLHSEKALLALVVP
jgi:ornithine carbamoyltransferase